MDLVCKMLTSPPEMYPVCPYSIQFVLSNIYIVLSLLLLILYLGQMILGMSDVSVINVPIMEMDITLVVYDRRALELSSELVEGVEQYIDEKYVEEHRPKADRLNSIFRRRDKAGYSSEYAKEWTVGIMDDYRPFVEEGKVWKVGTISGNPVQIVDYYYFDGDTIIDGKTCKQMMCQRFVSPDYSNEYWTPKPFLKKVGAWYEEDKKVYFYDEITQSMRLMYDFSLDDYETVDFLNMDGYPPFIIGPKQTGGIEGFKGVYREIMMRGDEGQHFHSTFWLEGVGDINGPTRIPIDPILDDPVPEFLMSCVVGDEVIYYNDKYEDGATPAGARKNRFDFTHTPKIQPKTRISRGEEPLDLWSLATNGTQESVYGEYNDLQLGINLDPLDDAYLVSITNDSGKTVYEKTINAGNIVGLNIDISAYAKGRYTVTVENSRESFTGEFETLTTGISDAVRLNDKGKMINDKHIYNLQGQRLSRLQKGLNIVNGRKIYVKD